jgi:hypothetical protein
VKSSREDGHFGAESRGQERQNAAGGAGLRPLFSTSGGSIWGKCLSLVNLENQTVWVISPEDLILSKLQWVQKLQSERQLHDIKQLLKSPELDEEYLQHWVRRLNLETFGSL